jgi:hypothetical protein
LTCGVSSCADFVNYFSWIGGTAPLEGQEPVARCERSLVAGVIGIDLRPDEFLHVPTGKRVSACIADMLADHAMT